MKIEKNQGSKTLVLFDFDGTLTTGDTLWRFLVFAKGWGGAMACFWKSLPGIFALPFSGKWSNGAAKELILAAFFKGQSRLELEKLGERFCENVLPRFFREDVFQELEKHQTAGATVVLVSASVDFWLRPFAKKFALVLLCTEAKFDATDCFSGSFATPNCKGLEKVRRIAERFNREDFEKIVAYGNSNGDREMLAFADFGVWV